MRGAGKARVIGRPGASARRHASLWRQFVELYRTVPWWMVTAGGVLIVAVVAAASISIDVSPVAPVLVTALLLGGVHGALLRPQVAATTLVVLLFLPFAPILGVLYGQSDNNPAASLGAIFTMLVAVVAIAWLAHRTSRSRPWLTTLLAYLAMSVPGPVVLLAVPWLGFFIAYAMAGVVLFVRGGGLPWLADACRNRWQRIRQRFQDAQAWRAGKTAELRRWRRGAQGEELTGALLEQLGERYTVLHDLAVPGSKANVDHVVIGPGGVFVIDSKMYAGVVREHPTYGLMHNNRPLTSTLNTLLFERDRVAAALELPIGEVRAVMVIHDAQLPEERIRVALHDHTGQHTGDVVVVAPGALLRELDSGFELLGTGEVEALVARARRHLKPATSGQPSTAPVLPMRPHAVGAYVLDVDGRPKTGTPPAGEVSHPQPGVGSRVDVALEVGQAVVLVTEDGLVSGYRVCGQVYSHPEQGVVVPVCTEEEWRQALEVRMLPPGQPWPVEFLNPA